MRGGFTPPLRLPLPYVRLGHCSSESSFLSVTFVLVRGVNKLVALLLALLPVVLVALQKRERGVFLP